jgi:murein DD-endopeptidase MepM/ murein hydrolase activator NlpD
MSTKTLFCIALFTLELTTALAVHGDGGIIVATPTDTSKSMLRGHEGLFGAPRGGGKTHAGVDIVANQSSNDKNYYRVTAVADGTVAYAMTNGEGPGEGYGYTVIIDHQNGTYTLYAHLATIASSGLVKVGDTISRGTLIGYMADLANNEGSSGNVIAKSVPAYDKIQVHFEEFNAPAGRTSTGPIASIKQGGTIIDPTVDLKTHGYTQAN